MKVLDFKPRLFSTLKNYSKETFMSDLMAGIIVGIVALPLVSHSVSHQVYHPRKELLQLSLQDSSSLCSEEARYKSEDRPEHSSSSFMASFSNMEKRD